VISEETESGTTSGYEMTDITDRHDIETREDIERLVKTFYTGTFADPVLGPIFVDIVKLDLPRHMPIMCDFWENILFGARKYPGGMMMVHHQVHQTTSLQPHHFQRWLDYFEETVDRFFEGPRANMAKTHAGRVGVMMAGRFNELPGGAEAHVWESARVATGQES
jgi:hemoglobin